MQKSKFLNQSLLLVAALVFIAAMMSLIFYLGDSGVPDRLSFFIGMSCISLFIWMWQLLRWFRHTSRFWAFFACWVILHVATHTAWGLYGRNVELCVVTIFVEGFILFRLSKSLSFQRMISARVSDDASEAEPAPPISPNSL